MGEYDTTLHTAHINALVQQCNNSSALAMELLQSCTKPLIYILFLNSSFAKSSNSLKWIVYNLYSIPDSTSTPYSLYNFLSELHPR